MDMLPVLPALEGASVTGLIPALIGERPAPWMPEAVRGAKSVVLLVLDGLGANEVESRPEILRELAAMDGTQITTVVPSTTSTALTSIATGLAPAQHGILGFRMLVDDDVLNVLRWQSNARPVPDPFTMQRHDAFLGRPVPVVTRLEFRDSGFSQAHLRGSTFVGWKTVATLVEHCRRLVRSGEKFVYAYYPGVDEVAHAYGLHDEFYERELAAADLLVGNLLDVLPADCALLVTADHGQVHLEAESWIEIDELHPLLAAQAGDGRFRYLHARKGKAADLLAAAHARLDDVAWVLSRREILEAGWYGQGATGTVPGRIGDVVVAAREPVAFVDPALPRERSLRSAHGSLTAQEMYVPLRAARGRA
jgi:predicted AlkP superfamily pyrophosphatase or phosphodiesterase